MRIVDKSESINEIHQLFSKIDDSFFFEKDKGNDEANIIVIRKWLFKITAFFNDDSKLKQLLEFYTERDNIDVVNVKDMHKYWFYSHMKTVAYLLRHLDIYFCGNDLFVLLKQSGFKDGKPVNAAMFCHNYITQLYNISYKLFDK